MIEHHPVLAALRVDRRTHAERYRELFRHAREPGEVDLIRADTNGNHALGNDCFAAQLASKLGRRVTRGRAGQGVRGAGFDEEVSEDPFE